MVTVVPDAKPLLVCIVCLFSEINFSLSEKHIITSACFGLWCLCFASPLFPQQIHCIIYRRMNQIYLVLMFKQELSSVTSENNFDLYIRILCRYEHFNQSNY